MRGRVGDRLRSRQSWIIVDVESAQSSDARFESQSFGPRFADDFHHLLVSVLPREGFLLILRREGAEFASFIHNFGLHLVVVSSNRFKDFFLIASREIFVSC